MPTFSKLFLAIVALSCLACGQSQNIDTQIKGSRWPAFGTDSGAANAYAVTTVAPLGPALRTGSQIMFFAANANTSASTLAVDGGSAIAIKKNVSSALTGGEIIANGIVIVTYDGTNFQISSSTAGINKHRGISFTVYNSGGLTSGTTEASYDLLTIPFGCAISAYDLTLAPSGTVTVKFWRKATGTAIPTSSDSISTSGVSISSGTAIHSTTLSDFTSTAIAKDDILAMDITAVSTATLVNGVLECDE